jgi:hypothetical protein
MIYYSSGSVVLWFSGSVVQRIKGSGDDMICGSVVQWFSGSEDRVRG